MTNGISQCIQMLFFLHFFLVSSCSIFAPFEENQKEQVTDFYNDRPSSTVKTEPSPQPPKVPDTVSVEYTESTKIIADTQKDTTVDPPEEVIPKPPENESKVKNQKIEALNIRISTLNTQLELGKERFHQQIHKKIEGYIISEATEFLLNINHYSCESYRFSEGDKGLILVLQLDFPKALSTDKREAGIKKLCEAFVNAIQRYEKVSSKNFSQFDTRVIGTYYGDNPQLISTMKTKMSQLNIPFLIEEIPEANQSLRLSLMSYNLFTEEHDTWKKREKFLRQELLKAEEELASITTKSE